MASVSVTICPWQKYRQCFNYKFIILKKNIVILSVLFLHYSENLDMLTVLIWLRTKQFFGGNISKLF